MEKEKYLSEERYQKNKNKLIVLAIVILVGGILLGGGLITIGIVKSNSNAASQEIRTEEDIQEEIDALNNELAPLKAKQNDEFFDNGMSEEYYRLDNEIDKLESKISTLEAEIWKTTSGFNNVANKISSSRYTVYYMIGGFIILASIMIAVAVFMFAKRREMMAFSVQQVMPVAEEGLEKIAPTVTKVGKKMTSEMAPAFGDVAKEVSKGIKEGLKEEEK